MNSYIYICMYVCIYTLSDIAKVCFKEFIYFKASIVVPRNLGKWWSCITQMDIGRNN